MMKEMKQMSNTEHSPKFELVKGYYDSGQWGIKAVKNAVKNGWITRAEYKEITGETYKK